MGWYIKAWKQFADFSGRSRRMEYWMFVLFNTILSFVLLIPFFFILFSAGASDDGELPPSALLAMAPLMLYSLAVIIPSLALGVRRFHDQDRSGWWMLISFIPYIGGLIFFVFMCLDGTAGQNRFGPDPKGRGGSRDDDVWPEVA